jgi:hypothetical protein
VFRRELHTRLEPILAAIDGAVMEAHGFALGGATRIALAHGEVRISLDLDFLGSNATGFAALRGLVRDGGVASILRPGMTLDVPREPSIDQYGIRFPVRVGTELVKVEIVREARVELEPPVREAFCALPLLSVEDCIVEKILANSDRGADATQFDRDILDLSILREAHGPISDRAWVRAARAYGEHARADVVKSLVRILRDTERRERDFRALRVDDADRVMRGLALLGGDLGVPVSAEQDDL